MTVLGEERDCSKCGAAIVVTERMVQQHRYICDDCWRARKRRWRSKPETIRAWTAANRDRINVRRREYWREQGPRYQAAHIQVHRALRAGTLVKGPCEACGIEKIEAHHDDYSRPLAIRWLCKPHHVEADRVRREAEVTKAS